MRTSQTACSLRAALLCVASLFAPGLRGSDPAHASSFETDASLDTEIESEIEPGDVQVYRTRLTAGLRGEFEARADDDGSATLTLRIRRPDGSEAAVVAGNRPRARFAVDVTGQWTAELASDRATDVEFEASAEPDDAAGGGGSTGADGSVTVHLDVPAGALVRLEVRRTAGAAPVVAAVRDGARAADDPAGAIQFAVNARASNSDRIRLVPLAVPGQRGLDVTVRGFGGGAGTYDVEAEVEDLDTHDASEDHGRAPRSILVTLAPGADCAAIAVELGYEVESAGADFCVLRTPSGREGFEDEDASDANARRDDVLAAEADRFVLPPEGSGTLHLVQGSDLGRSQFDGQSAFTTVRADKAHLVATGAGLVVAVLDTGIDRGHEAFAGRTVLPGRDFIDDDDDPGEVRDGIDQDMDLTADEGYGHGTFVAGIIASVAPGASVLPVRVLDSEGRGRVSAIVAGLQYAVAQGADVINLSLGGDGASPALRDAVNAVIARGVVVVAAAGNGGARQGLDFPASMRGVVAIAGATRGGGPAPFSDGIGGDIAAAAPSVDVIGPIPGGWARGSGTSYATAFGSGAAALLVGRKPELVAAAAPAAFRAAARPAPRSVPVAARRRLGAGLLDLVRILR